MPLARPCAPSPLRPRHRPQPRSGDATARIWDLSGGLSAPAAARVLDHPPGDDTTTGKDVTTLEWDPSGRLLATGAYDGRARIWTKDGAPQQAGGRGVRGAGAAARHSGCLRCQIAGGARAQSALASLMCLRVHAPAPPPPFRPAGKLQATLERHTGPVFALRWNKRGDLLLTSSADESTVVWDVATSSVRQQFSFQGCERQWLGQGIAGWGMWWCVCSGGAGVRWAREARWARGRMPPREQQPVCTPTLPHQLPPPPAPRALRRSRPGRRLAQRHPVCDVHQRHKHPLLQAGQQQADQDVRRPQERGARMQAGAGRGEGG